MRYGAFLRGINVGGRRVTGEQLCAPFSALGLEEVSSFLASGNIAFTCPGTDNVEDLEGRIEGALQAALGYPVEAFVRTAAEVSEVATREPFPAEDLQASAGKPQVTFLRNAPDKDAVTAAMSHATIQDPLQVVGRVWYWLPAAGISQSSLDVRAVERALGRGTTRTLNTVSRFHAKLLTTPAP